MARMLLSLALCVLVCTACVAASSCSWQGIDYSSLGASDLSTTVSGVQYTINVCGVVTTDSACSQQNSSASACESANGQVNVIGNVPAQYEWQFVQADDPSQGVQYTIVGADNCASSPWSGGPFVTNVILQCGEGAPVISSVSTFSRCTNNIVVSTPLACVQPKATCAYGPFDFSDLQGQVLTTSAESYNFSLALCNQLGADSPCTQRNANASACMTDASGSVMVGSWTREAQWSQPDSQSSSSIVVQLSMPSSTVDCTSSGPNPQPWNTLVQFRCGQGAAQLVAAVDEFHCNVVYTLITPDACTLSQLRGEEGIPAYEAVAEQ